MLNNTKIDGIDCKENERKKEGYTGMKWYYLLPAVDVMGVIVWILLIEEF